MTIIFTVTHSCGHQVKYELSMSLVEAVAKKEELAKGECPHCGYCTRRAEYLESALRLEPLNQVVNA